MALDILPPRQGGTGAATLEGAPLTVGDITDTLAAHITAAKTVISTADPRFLGGSKPDCTAQGVGTDLAPILQAAFDYGVTTYGNGFTVEVPVGPYRWATPVTLNGQGARNVTLRVLGQITPDATAMRCCSLVNMHKLKLAASIDEGGRFAGWGETLPWYCDYSATEDVVSAGGQEMFCIDGVNGYEVDLDAYGYAGRLLRVTDSQTSGRPPTTAIKGRIKTTRNLDFSKSRTAQSIWADPGTNTGQGNLGCLDFLCNDFDAFPPVFRDWNDVKINVVDAAYLYSGMAFRGCHVVQLPDLYVGDLDGRAPNVYHASFTSSASRGCANVQIGVARFLNSGNGILVSDCAGEMNLGEVYHYSTDAYPHGTTIEINNTPDVRGRAFVNHDGGTVVYVHGAGCSNINLDVLAQVQHTGNPVFISSDVPGPVRLSGKIAGVAAGYSCVLSQSTGYVALRDLDLKKGSGVHLNLPASNNTVWESGSYDGGSIAYAGSTPVYVDTNKVRAV
jgi:hypothetical protein